MGELSVKAASYALNVKKLSRYNQIILNMAEKQIQKSLDEINTESGLLCSITTGPETMLNYSIYQSSSDWKMPSHRYWLSNLTNNLNAFIKNNLPGRERLSVAIGISKMIHNNQHYKSFSQPLIEAITALFNHLELQSRAETILVHFTAFQDLFVRMCDRAIEITKLISFGPEYSRISFSHLLSNGDLKILSKSINNTHLNPTSNFKRQRITQRLMNQAQYRTMSTHLKSKVCLNKSECCSCSGRQISLSIPKISLNQSCLVKIRKNKYKDVSGSVFLADESYAITVTKDWQEYGGIFWGGLVKVLQAPIVKLNNETQGWLISRNSVFFPVKANMAISMSCNLYQRNASNGYKNSTFQINTPGILRIQEGCNYISPNKSMSIHSPTTFQHMHITQPLNISSNFTFLNTEDELSPELNKLIENKFEQALLGEDVLQITLEDLKAQSWIKSWINMFLDYMLPSVSGILFVTVAPLIIYLFSCCFPSMCKCSKANDQDDIEKRVEKLEQFFTFYVSSKFHELKYGDIKQEDNG